MAPATATGYISHVFRPAAAATVVDETTVKLSARKHARLLHLSSGESVVLADKPCARPSNAHGVLTTDNKGRLTWVSHHLTDGSADVETWRHNFAVRQQATPGKNQSGATREAGVVVVDHLVRSKNRRGNSSASNPFKVPTTQIDGSLVSRVRLRSDSLFGFRRNRCSGWFGTGVRLQSERVFGVARNLQFTAAFRFSPPESIRIMPRCRRNDRDSSPSQTTHGGTRPRGS